MFHFDSTAQFIRQTNHRSKLSLKPVKYIPYPHTLISVRRF